MLKSVMAVLVEKELEIQKLKEELNSTRQQLRFKKVTINDMRHSKRILHKEIERLQNINNSE